MNYAIAQMNNKIYLYGGLNDRNQVLESMEMFDACTYKMTNVKYRLDARAMGRQGHAMIAVDKFNMIIIGGTSEAGFIDPQPLPQQELVYSFDLEASTWHPKSSTLGPGSEPAPWNLVYHSLFKVDTQNVGILWYDSVQREEGLQRVMRTSIYNMINNTWKTIRLVNNDFLLEPSYRFGATLVPIFDKHVTIREQMDIAKKVKPRAYGPIPLDRLLILGGVAIDDFSQEAANEGTMRNYMPCTVLHFTNSN